MVASKYPRLLAAGFAFFGGWADVICLVRYNAFAGMQTGNIVMIGKSMVSDSLVDVLFYVAVVLCNMSGVICLELLKWYRTVRGHGSRKRAATLLALPIAALLLTCDALDTQGTSRWHVCLVATALGAQNALVGSPDSLAVLTTIMTGNIAKLGACIVSLLKAQGRRKESLETWKTYGTNLALVLATVAGAVGAALMLRAADVDEHPTLWCLAPNAVGLALLLLALDFPYLQRTAVSNANATPTTIKNESRMQLARSDGAAEAAASSSTSSSTAQDSSSLGSARV